MKKKIVMGLFSELLKNSRRSDRELAKVLRVSQPTVTKMRKGLEDEGMIQEFTVIPDFAKIGFELMAIFSFKSKMKKELAERVAKWTRSKPNIIFAARCEGSGKNGIIISIHKNYACYCNFLADLRSESGEDLQDMDTILISLREDFTKPFSLKYLADLEEIE